MATSAERTSVGSHEPGGLAQLWPLRKDVAYLNHGSFGACPSAILAHQQSLRDQIEREPFDFLERELRGRLAAAREALGAFIGDHGGEHGASLARFRAAR
jgi:hypothetical protein